MSAPWVRPLPLAVALASGIALTRSADLGAAWWAIALALVLVGRRWRPAMLGAVFAVGAARGAVDDVHVPYADDREAERVVGVRNVHILGRAARRTDREHRAEHGRSPPPAEEHEHEGDRPPRGSEIRRARKREAARERDRERERAHPWR